MGEARFESLVALGLVSTGLITLPRSNGVDGVACCAIPEAGKPSPMASAAVPQRSTRRIRSEGGAQGHLKALLFVEGFALERLGDVQLILLIGQYAQRWHLGAARKSNLTETVRAWQTYRECQPTLIPLPHPSWRNNAWLKKNDWFSIELLPYLQGRVRELL